MMRILEVTALHLVLAAALPGAARAEEPVVFARQGKVILRNERVRVVFDPAAGTYAAEDLRDGTAGLGGVFFRVDGCASTDPGSACAWKSRRVYDALGKGRTLAVRSTASGRPDLLLEITLYEGGGFLVLAAGVENTTDRVLHVKKIEPIAGARAFRGIDHTRGFSMLDGNGGGEATAVVHGGALSCRNNLLVTFEEGERRRSLVLGGLTYHDFEKFAEAGCPREESDGRGAAASAGGTPPPVLEVRLFAADPVGRRVDPGARYLPEDRFYADFATDDPFEALERYALRMRAAGDIVLSVYDFPTVCLWYAHHKGYGGGCARNDTAGAVEEMDRIAASGFLEYARAAVRLVPDCYGRCNQQGWWDDEHWRMYGSTNLDMEGPTYVKPFETTAKWGRAVTERGGIPLTYFQSSFRSEDYAERYPEQMLFNEARAWKRPGAEHGDDDAAFWGNAWKRAAALFGYDYTEPDFRRHLEAVYANLRAGGIRGLMFDYPATAWAAAGGMEDPYATTASAYRAMFEAARRGLGEGCYIHERNLQRGSDVTLGLVASQRIWGDTDRITPAMVTRGGLRWYKNRVVVNYDMDAKNLLRPGTRDARRRLLTMAYAASGRLLLATNFGGMDPETLHDLTRIFPFHGAPRSARPVDAFVREVPRVYDFPVNSRWHQVVFYNPDDREGVRVGADLSGAPASGGLGLDPAPEYYAYDFWNDRLVGLLPGTARLEAELRPAEARMIALHAREAVPQWIATDRHIMQGFLDLGDTEWDAAGGILAGSARVVKDDPFRIVIAPNGYAPLRASVAPKGCRAGLEAAEGGLVVLRLSSPATREVCWSVAFTKGESGGPGVKYSFLSGEGSTTFPFEMHRGHLLLKVDVDGTTLRLTLDNGVLWDELLLYGGPGIEALKLGYDGKKRLGEKGDENPVETDTVSGLTIGLPGVEIRNQRALVTPASSGFMGTLREVRIGRYSLKDVPAGFTEAVGKLGKEPRACREKKRIPWQRLLNSANIRYQACD